jgi:hypothetical protein
VEYLAHRTGAERVIHLNLPWPIRDKLLDAVERQDMGTLRGVAEDIARLCVIPP